MTTNRQTPSARPPRPFDAVLCDVDNVIRLYDPSELFRLERAAGVAEGTTTKLAFAPERVTPLLLGAIGHEEWADSIARGFDGQLPRESARALAAALVSSPFRADGAVVELLRRVRSQAGLPLVLVTNATLRLEGELASLGLSDLADHVVSSARVGLVKPDPRIFALAADLAGVAAERCLFVDDTAENVEAAVAGGMTGVHYREPADLRTALGALLGT